MKLTNAIFILSLLFSGWALGIELGTAKEQGLVGEQANGYLGILQPSPEVERLVEDINGKRRAAYRDIAQRNGTDLEAVEQLAGKKALERTPSGQFVKGLEGDWVQVR